MRFIILPCAIFFISITTQAIELDYNMSISQAQVSCSQWAKLSKTKGISKLIIAYEGLFSYNEPAYKALKKYQQNLRQGISSRLRLSGSGGYVAKAVFPKIINSPYYFEFAILPHTSEELNKTSIAEACILEWYKVFGSSLDINILGHSFGGYASIFLMHKLNKRNVPINNMITFDPRGYSSYYQHFYVDSNVHSFSNFYRRGFWLPGYPVAGAENNKLSSSVSHADVPSASQSQKAIWELFN